MTDYFKPDDEILKLKYTSDTRLPWASPSEERYAEIPVGTLRVTNNATEGFKFACCKLKLELLNISNNVARTRLLVSLECSTILGKKLLKEK